jgi:hypothetical protein
LHRVSGELAQAEGCHQQAWSWPALSPASGTRHALAGLGRCALAEGHAAQAEVLLLGLALEIFQRIGAAEARTYSPN